MDAISSRLALPRVAAGVGSSVYNDFIVPMTVAVGLDASAYDNKYRRLQAVIECLGGTYDPTSDTSEATESGGGGTLTNAGLAKILALLDAQPERSLDEIETELEESGAFDPDGLVDARERSMRAVAMRRGQADFRRGLMAAYGSRCAVTRFDAPQALEAAHIVPYAGPTTNTVRNGILLRADIHTLFDVGQLGIDPDDGHRVVVARSLVGTSYAQYADRDANVPRTSLAPDPGLLRWHLHRWGLDR
jgi:hypothetical protein